MSEKPTIPDWVEGLGAALALGQRCMVEISRLARTPGPEIEQLITALDQTNARIETLEAALRCIQDCLGYDKNEGKSLTVREANSHSAWKIARAALDAGVER